MRFSRSDQTCRICHVFPCVCPDDRQDALRAQQPLTGPAMLLKSMLGIDPNMIMQAIGEIMAGVKAMNEALARIEAMHVETLRLARLTEMMVSCAPWRTEEFDQFNSSRPPNGPGGDGVGDSSIGSEG